MAKPTVEQLKKALTPDQVRYAEMVVANEFSPKADRITKKEIAAEIGVSDRTLRNWDKDIDVIRYISYQTEMRQESFYPVVVSQLESLIRGGNNGVASTKAIEIYLKLTGKLQDRQQVIVNEPTEDQHGSDKERLRNEIEEYRSRIKDAN